MTDWFRSWHGAPTDPKWLGIAKRAGVAPGIAVAVAWALMDRASQAADRGSVEGYDAEGLAYFYGCEPEQVDAIVDAMTAKGMVENGRFANWEKRQPKREDGAAERAKEWRERNRTQPNATEPPDTDTDTEVDTESKKEPTALVPSGSRVRKANGHDPEVYSEFEEVVWADFPRHPNSRKEPAYRAYQRLPLESRAECIRGVMRYAERFKTEVDPKRDEAERLRFVPHLVTWINQKGWEVELERTH